MSGSPASLTPTRSSSTALDRVKIEGKYSGTIILKRPYIPFMSTALPWIPGHIISKKAVEKLGKKFSSNPIGTGPYEFVSYTPGQKLVMKRFEGGTGPPPDLGHDRAPQHPGRHGGDECVSHGRARHGHRAHRGGRQPLELVQVRSRQADSR